MASRKKKGSSSATPPTKPATKARKRRAVPPASEDDRAVWQAVKDTVSPMRLSTTKTFRGIINAAEKLPPTPQREATPKASGTKLTAKTRYTVAPEALLKGRRRAVNYDTSKTELKPGQLQGLDRKRGDRLRKGKLEIEGTLDLHGMTRDQAQGAVRRFIEASQSMGRRTVLVITGKGYSQGGDGVLRSELPRWLNADPLRSKIVAYDFAQPRHGGQGAFYVYIKKVRDAS